MPLRRLPSLRATLIASMLALPMFAGGALAAAHPVEPQANSLQSAIDDFVSYLKSETNEAARIVRENKHTIDAAKSHIGSLTADWRAALSRQKERLKTLRQDASAMWEDWNETAVSSWAEAGRRAHMALDWIGKWMRNQSLSDQRPEIPV
jgi:TPP-dependent trihydroxycyclohexane-1,2-dione (THcHDO) dehydratase